VLRASRNDWNYFSNSVGIMVEGKRGVAEQHVECKLENTVKSVQLEWIEWRSFGDVIRTRGNNVTCHANLRNAAKCGEVFISELRRW